MTAGEALAALQQATLSAEANKLTSATVEISTDFTIGEGAAKAAEEVRNKIQANLPCAEITLQNGTLTTKWGAKPGNCSYRGITLSGESTFTIEKNDMGNVLVKHTWTDLSDGKIKLTGDATVTWDFANKSRNVVHNATWTRISDGKTGKGSGNRTQRPYDSDKGLLKGLRLEGSRSWEGDAGR